MVQVVAQQYAAPAPTGTAPRRKSSPRGNTLAGRFSLGVGSTRARYSGRMKDVLQDPSKKIRRAIELFGQLRSAIEAFAPSARHEIVCSDVTACVVHDAEMSRSDAAPEIRRFFAILARSPRCPEEWGPMIGDIANNARHALDVLVAAASSLERADRRRVELCFPICDSAEVFDKNAQKNIRGLSPARVAYVRECQPFAVTGGTSDWLRLLKELNNRDKHREICTTAAYSQYNGLSLGGRIGANISEYGFGIRINRSVCQFGPHTKFMMDGGEVGPEFTPIGLFSSGPEDEIRLSPHFVPEIRFAKEEPHVGGLPVLSTLESMIKRVDAILAGFPYDF